jgi:DNA-binding CsgD family transcriptional regulator
MGLSQMDEGLPLRWLTHERSRKLIVTPAERLSACGQTYSGFAGPLKANMNLHSFTPVSSPFDARVNANSLETPAEPTDPDLLMSVLDEIDYGLCVLRENGYLAHANQIALDAMRAGGTLMLHDDCVQARDPTQRGLLASAIKAAQNGRRGMLVMRHGIHECSLALTPLNKRGQAERNNDDTGHAKCLLVMGKQHSYEQLSLTFFAQAHGLSPAEVVVLGKLCAGHSPKEIAIAVGVAVSTVRTQISSVRGKTRTDSIRDLARRIAALPPVTLVLKHGFLN